MNRTHVSVPGLVCSWVAMCLLSSAQAPQTSSDAGPAIRLTSYQVVQLDLRAPVVHRDSAGREQTYHRAFLVTLKGDFPRDQGLGLELFIGDYRIPEYGGTRDGLYFRIYDPKTISGFEGKEIKYRFGGHEIRSFGIRFSTKGSQPLKVIKETSPIS